MPGSQYDIDLLVSPEAKKQVDDLNAALDATVAKCTKVVEMAGKMNASLGRKNSGGVGDQIKQIDELEKANAALSKTNGDLALEIAKVKEAARQANQELRLKAKEALAAKDAYNQLDAKLELTRNKFKQLTEEEQKNTAQGQKLQAEIKQMDEALKRMDMTMGKTNRLVGDYKNQLKDLGAQIQKNINEYNSLSLAQKQSAPGQQLKASIMQMGTSYVDLSNAKKGAAGATTSLSNGMLSFNNVIGKSPVKVNVLANGLRSLWAVMLRAAYTLPGVGIAGLIALLSVPFILASKHITLFKDANKDLNDVRKKGIELAHEEKAAVDVLYKSSQNESLSKEHRLNSINKLISQYPAYFDQFSKEEIMAGKAASAYNELSKAIINSGIARAAQEELGKIAAKMLKLELDAVKDEEALIKARQGRPSTPSGQGIGGYTVTAVDANRPRNMPDIDRDREARKLQEKYNKLLAIQQKYASMSLGLDKKAGGGSSDGSKSPSLNRVELEIKAYEHRSKVLELQLLRDEITEIQYFDRMVDLAREYQKNRAGLTKEEKESELNFNIELEKSERDYYNNILKILEGYTEEAGVMTDRQLKRRIADSEYLVEKARWEHEQELKYITEQMDAQERMLDDQEKKDEAFFRAKMERLSRLNNVVQFGTSAIIDLTEIQHQREMARISEKEKAQSETYENQLRYIDQSGMSEAEKARERKRIDAEYNAQQKQNEREREAAQKRQARTQRTIDIANLTGATTVAVMSALGAKPYSPLNIVMAAAAGAKGLAELAKLLAAPLPGYYKGRKGLAAQRGEWAIVGELGPEGLKDPSGNISLTPGKPTVTYLSPGTEVIPHHEIINDAAYRHLRPYAANNTIQTQAMLNYQREQVEEIKGLREDVRNLTLSPVFYNYGGFYSYKESNRL